jgi:hypothetical protein
MYEYIQVSPYRISDEVLNEEGDLDGVDWLFEELIGREKRRRLEREDEHNDDDDEEAWSNSAEQESPMEVNE